MGSAAIGMRSEGSVPAHHGMLIAGPGGASLMLPALAVLASASLCVLIAGAVRGYSGFGFAMAAVPLLSLVLEPAAVVPVVMVLQIVTGLDGTLREWAMIEPRPVALLMPGAVVGMVPGLLLLAAMPPDLARLVIGLAVASAVVLLATGWKLPGMPRPRTILGVGLASGVLNGVAAIAGPPVIAMYLASPRPVEVIRATLVFYFLLTSLVGLLIALERGMIGTHGFVLALVLVPGMWIGTRAGEHLFRRFHRHYRAVGVAILSAIALVAIARAAYGLLGF